MLNDFGSLLSQLSVNSLATMVGYVLISYALFGQLVCLRIVSVSMVASIMCGAYAIKWAKELFGLSDLTACFVIAMLVGSGVGILGALIHSRLGYRNRGAGLLASIGFVQFFRGVMVLTTGGTVESFPLVIASPLSQNVFGSKPEWLVTGLFVSVLSGLTIVLMLKRNRIGTSSVALGDDPELLALAGVNGKSVEIWVQAVGGAIAALAGIFLALDSGIRPDLGLVVTLKVFAILLASQEKLWLIPVLALGLSGLENVTSYLWGGQVSQAIGLSALVCVIGVRTTLLQLSKVPRQATVQKTLRRA